MPRINMIRKEGGSRVVSISTIIPKDWQSVEIEVIKSTKNVVTAKFSKVK